jgi:1,4-dihydroxy-6-naphthoate synthase
MKLTLGFSPCPNDTFIFDALVHGRIDAEGLEFRYHLADVEELNREAFTGEPDITKMSCFAYGFAAGNYLILDSGSAIGYKKGPLLISRRKIDMDKIADARIAIPGNHTTANMLFSIAWPEAQNKKEYVFSDIEDVLLNDEADAGLIIHETRFSYFRKGLIRLADMGEYWERQTGLPIPLGIIAVNRRVSAEIAFKVNRIIRRSLEYALNDAMPAFDFVRDNAQDMDSSVMNNHIKLYVNKFTLDLGVEGRRAITELYRIAGEKKLIPEIPDRIFLT